MDLGGLLRAHGTDLLVPQASSSAAGAFEDYYHMQGAAFCFKTRQNRRIRLG